MTPIFTQDQLNTVVRSYQDEINRLLEVKANLTLALQAVRQTILEKDKTIESLKNPKPEEVKTNGKVDGRK